MKVFLKIVCGYRSDFIQEYSQGKLLLENYRSSSYEYCFCFRTGNSALMQEDTEHTYIQRQGHGRDDTCAVYVWGR
jgi:hypothetical protein